MDRGYILHATERTRGGRAELNLVGRLESGETFAVVGSRVRPFFYLRTADLAQAEAVAVGSGQEVTFVPSDRTTMDGAEIVRLETPTTAAGQRVRDALHRVAIRTYEADMKLSSQVLMDLRIHGAAEIEGEWRKGRRVDRIYENPRLAPAELDPKLSVLSLDIETDARAATVYAAALVFSDPSSGTQTGEVLLNGPGPADAAKMPRSTGVPVPLEGGTASSPNAYSRTVAKCFPSEEAMLTALRARIVALDPDIITGWNVVDFDFRVLSRRFASLGVPFDIGRSDSAASFLDRVDNDGVTRWNRAKAIVPGRQVLDGLWLARMAGMGLEDYRLETVAQSVLGRGKRIDELPGETRTASVERLYRTDPQSLCAYCLEDTRLALEILEKEGLLDLALAKSLLIGTSLEQTSMSVASFEFLYTEHLHQRGMVAPTLGIDQDMLERAPGGGIITPRAGLFTNVLAFDFKSLYPSIMRTFNIDPVTRLRPGQVPNGQSAITAPNGAQFRREPGILPEILDRFFESREAAKRRGDRRAVYAYKIVMNSFYGVLGTSGCRFAASALAGAVTTFGQHILYWARDKVAGRGLEVIYGDTDSLFVISGTAGDAGAAELSGIGRELARFVNAELTAYARSAYGVESRLELEFEAVYRRFFLPPMRTAGPSGDDSEEEPESRGRAKGYAGLRVTGGPDGRPDAEALEIVGLEAIRHDWTPLAQELQRELLMEVFHGAAAAEIDSRVRALLKELRAGKADGKLAYRKSLRKPVEAYTKSSPPHARAAALLPPEERSGLIRYVWTTEGPQPEGRLTAPPDYDHYVQKQVKPIVESLAPYIGLSTDNLFSAGGQLGLF